MRVVSLCPSLTELVFDLGRGEDLVGVTHYCVHPQDAVEQVEKVGGTKDPEIERIVELAPDLVLLNREENRSEDAAALATAGLYCHISMPRNPMETVLMVRSIGDALERSEEAERIANEIEERSARVAREAEGLTRIRFAYLIWSKPWMTVNSDTFAHSLLAQAGGLNVFGGRPERYPEITTEELTAARPDVVLLCTEPFPFRNRHIEELSHTTGLAPERFCIADGEYLCGHGSRTPDGIDYAERLIQSARERIGIEA